MQRRALLAARKQSLARAATIGQIVRRLTWSAYLLMAAAFVCPRWAARAREFGSDSEFTLWWRLLLLLLLLLMLQQSGGDVVGR